MPRAKKKAIPEPPPSPPTKAGYVAIVGRTNVGKSTLLNQIVGKKIAIISDKPQTTRTRILGVRTEARGQMVFFDTPGVHKPGHELNRRMVQHIYEALHTADVLVHVIDITQSFGHGEQFVLDIVKNAGRKALLVINKIDLVKKSKILELIDFYRQQHDYSAYLPVSALTGDGVPDLVDEIFGLLPQGEFFYGEGFITDSPERFLVSELIREKVLRHTRQELPFATAVVVDLWDDSRRAGENQLRIEASILVERDSQKGIVIGRAGQMLKAIGSEARRECEELLGCRLWLGLFVRVEPNWRNNPALLQQMGMNR
jgi:GTP-binding protein Era